MEEWRFHLLRFSFLCEEQSLYRNEDYHFEDVKLEVLVDIRV